MSKRFIHDGTIKVNRLPGYKPDSEWNTPLGGTYAGAFAANIVTSVKAAGGTMIRNVITGIDVSAYAGATAFSVFLYLCDGTTTASGVWFCQFNLAINSDKNWGQIWMPDDPIIGSRNTQTSILLTSAGVAGCAVQLNVKGYQIIR
jgi:hypothetical protein